MRNKCCAKAAPTAATACALVCLAHLPAAVGAFAAAPSDGGASMQQGSSALLLGVMQPQRRLLSTGVSGGGVAGPYTDRTAFGSNFWTHLLQHLFSGMLAKNARARHDWDDNCRVSCLRCCPPPVTGSQLLSAPARLQALSWEWRCWRRRWAQSASCWAGGPLQLRRPPQMTLAATWRCDCAHIVCSTCRRHS